MRYAVYDLESRLIPSELELPPGYTGAGILIRDGGVPIDFVMQRATDGRCRAPIPARSRRPPATLIAPSTGNNEPVSLTVAICTRNRPVELDRCLAALRRTRAGGPAFEILVVDNAPADDRTLSVVSRYPSVRYLVERTPGLARARNAAVRAATGEVIAFTDDDVVPDPDWIMGLRRAIRENPGAIAFSGPVAPLELETEAQIVMEGRGGLGHSFRKELFASTLPGSWSYPCGEACFGAGANMAFRRVTFDRIGYFDESLGPGTHTRGGEDLDIFYRVVRAGLTWAYEPEMLVFHQHRREMDALESQVESWGRGLVAYMLKSYRADPANRGRIALYLLRTFVRKAAGVAASLANARRYHWPSRLAWAELRGACAGFGAYSRSLNAVRGRSATCISEPV